MRRRHLRNEFIDALARQLAEVPVTPKDSRATVAAHTVARALADEVEFNRLKAKRSLNRWW